MLDSSVLTLLLRLVVSLGIVIGLMLLLSGWLRKRGVVLGGANGSRTRSTSTAALEIVTRKPLGRNAQLAIVRAGNKTLVLGITEQNITMLSETEIASFDIDIDIDSPEAQRTGLPSSTATGTFPTWKTLLEGVRERTLRH